MEERVEELDQRLPGLVRKRGERGPEDDTEEDQRQHVGRGRGLNDVLRNDVEKELDRRIRRG